MRNKFLIITTLLCLVGFAAACKEKKNAIEPPPNPPTSNNAPFTFFNVGNEWTYGIYNAEDELMETFGFRTVSEVDGIFLNRYKLILSQHWYTDGDYWIIDTIPQFDRKGWVLMQRDCSVGQKWETHYEDGRSYTTEIVSVSETVTVPAATFNDCIKIKMTYTFNTYQSESYYWIHKDFGIIMQEDSSGVFKIPGGVTAKLHSKNFD